MGQDPDAADNKDPEDAKGQECRAWNHRARHSSFFAQRANDVEATKGEQSKDERLENPASPTG